MRTPADAIIGALDLLILETDGPIHPVDTMKYDIEILALALKLKKRPDLAFRAIMEGWDQERIVRELF